jgi:hypothetical protein
MRASNRDALRLSIATRNDARPRVLSGGDAVWKEDGERGLALPLPDKPLMFVGQNFDDEDDPVQYQRTPFS